MRDVLSAFFDLLHLLRTDSWHVILLFMPFVLFFELPLYLLILVGNAIFAWENRWGRANWREYAPPVTFLISCYSEGQAVKQTLHTLFEQIYDGRIEIIAIVDGALQNQETLKALKEFSAEYGSRYPRRRLRILPKFQRGGRVSSLNSGLMYATGEIIIAVDADTSFDNDMVSQATHHFADPKVCAVSGALFVRNYRASLVSRLQRLEYLISLMHSKTGLTSFNIVNNVSGAFGIFRRDMLEQIGGWNVGTAEDLDTTLRIKQYTRRTGCVIRFDPFAIGHTDAPDTWRGFFKQRLRWDGDLGYLYLRKHSAVFSPRLVGWPNYIMLIWNGLFFQIAAPFIIFIYSTLLSTLMPFHQWLALNMLVMAYYFCISVVMFCSHLLFTSRNVREDLRLMWLLPFFGVFTYCNRLWSCVALLNEGLRRGHEESAMAPWWVLKRKNH